MAQQPIGIFFSYAHADDELRDQLARQLKILEHQQLAATWCDRQIPAGSQWANVIDDRLNAADITVTSEQVDSKFEVGVKWELIVLNRILQTWGDIESWKHCWENSSGRQQMKRLII